jgi:hypothetical protein
MGSLATMDDFVMLFGQGMGRDMEYKSCLVFPFGVESHDVFILYILVYFFPPIAAFVTTAVLFGRRRLSLTAKAGMRLLEMVWYSMVF